jgi:peroxiredoxin
MNPKSLLYSVLFGFFLMGTLPSQAVEVGAQAPDFTLKSVEGKDVKLSDYKGKVVVLEFYNMGCPFVKKHYKNGDMQALQTEYTGKDVVWLAINSTNPDHKDYLSPDEAKKEVAEHKIAATAMLQDLEGTVGKSYEAKTTPHMYVIDASGKVVYQGAIDDAPDAKSDPKAAKNYVRSALNEVLSGKGVTEAKTKQYGCSIKYKS